MNNGKKPRLASLDFLRGLDMMLLMVVSPLFVAAHRAWKLPAGVMYQMEHPE